MEISMKLHQASLLPGGRLLKEWGRKLSNTDDTMSLPKLYWVTGAGPKTCGVEVDIDGRMPDATDLLSLYDIAFGAGQVIVKCFFKEGVLGLYRTGANRRIVVRLVRIDKRGLLRLGEGEEIASGGGGGVLRSVDIGGDGSGKNDSDTGVVDFS